MSSTPWLDHFLTYNGVKEIKGPHHNPKIIELIDRADGKDDGKQLQGIKDDETPYCASALCGSLEESGIQSPRSAWARSFLKWGVKLSGPAVGAIVVFERGPTSGHVGMVRGRDRNGNLVVFGANQGDMFKDAPFPTSRVLGYRWPKGVPLPNSVGVLPTVVAGSTMSTNEA
jgi:uncharacterized protein (TIGR02594 family)